MVEEWHHFTASTSSPEQCNSGVFSSVLVSVKVDAILSTNYTTSGIHGVGEAMVPLPPLAAWQYNVYQFKASSTAAELVIHHFWSQKMAKSGNYINTVKWRTRSI